MRPLKTQVGSGYLYQGAKFRIPKTALRLSNLLEGLIELRKTILLTVMVIRVKG